MADFDVVVMGAGLGGLSAGALLARQGRKVAVLEQSDRVGGCCSTFEKDGFHFDTGASIVEVLHPMELAFRELGTSLQQEVDLIPCDPVMSVVYRDGGRLNLPQSIDGAAAAISALSPEDGRRWYDFCAYMSELVEVVLNTVFILPANNLSDMAAMVRKDRRLARFLPVFLSSYQDVIQRFFRDPRVLGAMGYQAFYLGLPPALVPGAFAMLPYTEHLGVYYPRGGMIQIPLALQRCGERHGMEVYLNTRVSRVLVEKGRAIGVALADGAEIRAKVVVSDVNAKTLYQEMIGPQHLPPMARRGIASYRYSKAVPMIYLGLDYAPPLDAHHSIVAITPEEVNRYWWNYVEQGRLKDDTFGLICWPTHSDPGLAPRGRHVLNLIPEGFYHLAGTSWDAEKAAFVERTIEYFSSFAIPGLKDHVLTAECATPVDFQRKLLLPEGAIYCLQQDLPASTVFRPASRSKSIRGLYLAGASTHPGGGVPTTIASGLITSRLVAQHES